MKTVYAFLFSCLVCLSLFAQTEKGATPLAPPPSEGAGGRLRAVVIGISDYQDDKIPDLRFADKDAEAFANFLRSPAGGSLDGDHLKVLINSEATIAQFDAGLGWLIDESKEGDQAIIYFSGHGDAETKTRSQQGFLLCWDSPPQAYVSGAYPIFFLKEVVSTLSLENKARVILITDACRSGKLAGNADGGPQLTSQNLAQQFANEIKILSCQPDEYSIEGEQWGGGRGVFSYHLVDGLYGMADGNADASVNLMEIGRYLEDHVTAEVAPQSQLPMTVGNRTEKLAVVFPDLLAQAQKNKAGELPVFAQIDSRGIEEEVLATVDTTVRELYFAFKKALKDKVFLEPTDDCADAYYERLIAEPKLKRLHNAMRRNYAAALQDDAQQVLNQMLRTGLDKSLTEGTNRQYLYLEYPRQLERAAELLGEGHYMYPMLKARQYFFEAYHTPDREAAIKLADESLKWQPDQPYVYFFKSTLALEANDPETALLYLGKAKELAPNWVRTFTLEASIYANFLDQKDKALQVYREALAIDSNSMAVWYSYGRFLQATGKYEESIPALTKVIESKDPDVCFFCAYAQLMVAHIELNNYEKALVVADSVLRHYPENTATMSMKALAYTELNQLEQAHALFYAAMKLGGQDPFVHLFFAHYFATAGNMEQVQPHLDEAFRLSRQFTLGNLFWLAELQLTGNNERNVDAAYFFLEQAISQDKPSWEFLHNTHYLKFTRQEKERWEALMKKYFPDQAKD